MQNSTLMANAIEAALNKAGQKTKTQTPCSLVISFTDISYREEFLVLLQPHFGDFHELDDCIVQFYPSYEIAQSQANKVNSILWNYSDLYAAKPFHEEWLDEYLKAGKYGVNCAMANHLVKNPSALPAYRLERAEDAEKTKIYHNQVSQSQQDALAMTRERFIDDFTQLTINNWEGWESANKVRIVIELMFAQISAMTKGMHYLPSSPAQDIIHAIQNKERYIKREGLSDMDIFKKSDHTSIGRTLDQHRANFKTWDKCRKALAEIAREEFPSLMRKGLGELLDDEDAKIPESVPFKGVLFQHDWQLNMNHRLSAHNLRYDIQEQGHNLHDMFAGAIAAYFLGIVELRQEKKLEENLREFSKVMNEKWLCDHFEELLKASLDTIA